MVEQTNLQFDVDEFVNHFLKVYLVHLFQRSSLLLYLDLPRSLFRLLEKLSSYFFFSFFFLHPHEEMRFYPPIVVQSVLGHWFATVAVEKRTMEAESSEVILEVDFVWPSLGSRGSRGS